MTLSDLSIGKMAIVDQISLGYHGQGLITRLEAMGLTPNKPIRVLRKAWLGGPLHIQVGATTEIAIRRQEAEKVLIRMEG
jgi:ferrous iron transport protein A